MELPSAFAGGDEDELAARWRRDGLQHVVGTAGHAPDQLLVPRSGIRTPDDWTIAFAAALTRTMFAAMDLAGGRRDELTGDRVPWDAQLARWFDEFVPSPQAVRSYARPSRRQASSPEIPRAGRYFPPEEVARCTFGVVLDTSGSMDHRLLGKALGAISSYAAARDVPAARVVFCDAAPHDAGYLPPAQIAGRVQVRGRGGTQLQPGVDLLQRAEDFPLGAPVLLITDGECDVLRVRREHAYLVPQGASLPFTPKGPVFRMR